MLESVTTSALTNRINWHLNNQTVCVVTVGEGSRRVSSAGLWWGFVFGTDRMPSSYWTLSSTWSLINKVPPQDGDQSQSDIRFKLWQKETLPGASITPTNGTIYLLACIAGVTNESIHRWTETVESMGWGELLHHRCSRVKITANHHFSTHRNENADLVVREHQPCARAFVLFYNFVALYLHQSLTSFD